MKILAWLMFALLVAVHPAQAVVMFGFGAGAGEPFLYDTYTGTSGTDIRDHTPDTGGTWTATTAYFDISATGDSIYNSVNDATWAQAINSATPTSADYTVSADIKINSTTGDRNMGVCARMVNLTNGYCAYMVGASGVPSTLYLTKVVSGVHTTLTSVAMTRIHTNTFAYHIELTVSGSNISATETNDNKTASVTGETTYQNAGYAGIHIKRQGGSILYVRAE